MLHQVTKEEKILSIAVAFLLVAQFSLMGLEQHLKVSEAKEAAPEARPAVSLCEKQVQNPICFDWQRLMEVAKHLLQANANSPQ